MHTRTQNAHVNVTEQGQKIRWSLFKKKRELTLRKLIKLNIFSGRTHSR